MKKFILILVIITSLLFNSFECPVTVEAAGNTVFQLAVDKHKISANEDFYISLSVNLAEEFYAYEATFVFGDQICEFIDAVSSQNGFLVPTVVKNNTITIAFTKIGASSFKKKVKDLCILHFKGQSALDYKITLKSVKVLDKNLKSSMFTIKKDITVKHNSSLERKRNLKEVVEYE